MAGEVKICPECGGNEEVGYYNGKVYYIDDIGEFDFTREGKECCYFNKAGIRNNILLYRGLGLPEKAIGDYEKLMNRIDKK